MVGSVQPFISVGTGQVVDDHEPPEICDLEQPDVVIKIAEKEDIQDYVAAMLVNAPHVNLTASYDDAGNLLAFTVDVDSAVDDAVNAIVPGLVAVEVAASHKRYTHDQTIPSQSWVINHNFGVIPYAVHITDTADNDVIGDIVHNNLNTTTINFGAAFAGTVILGG